MKESKWDENESLQDFLEANTMVTDEAEESLSHPVGSKMRVTELRRRIEERLDSRRIALECDYLDIEDALDVAESLQ